MTAAEKAFITLALVTAGFLAYMWLSSASPVLGSTIQGNDYMSTSTAASALFGARTVDILNIKGNTLPVSGALGTVVITGATTGVLNFYDATTTAANKRAADRATSTILIASFPASTAAGTYVFDAEYTDGLVYELFSGTMPTTTITYR